MQQSEVTITAEVLMVKFLQSAVSGQVFVQTLSITAVLLRLYLLPREAIRTSLIFLILLLLFVGVRHKAVAHHVVKMAVSAQKLYGLEIVLGNVLGEPFLLSFCADSRINYHALSALV